MKNKIILTEFLKIKRTLLFYLCVGAPLVICGIMFMVFYTGGEDLMAQADGNRWFFFAELVQTYWALLFLPLFITLQSALLSGIEHNGRMWKLLYAQPVRKLDILWGKLLAVFLVIGVSQALMLPLTLAGGVLLAKLNPSLGLEASIPIGQIALLDLTVYGLAVLAISLHAWVSLKWENFVTAVTFGIIATVSGVIVMNSSIARFYPWAMPGLIANHFFSESFPWTNLAYSLGAGIIVILCALLDLIRQETL